MAIHIWNSFTK